MSTWAHTYNPYATHQPVLYEALIRTTGLPGSVIELGCGETSTQLINKVAGKRTVYHLDHDKEWLKQFQHLENEQRIFLLLSNWQHIFTHFADENDLSVVFIDQGNWESRAQCVEFFKDKGELIIVHDSDYLLANGLIKKYEDHYKYVKTFMPLKPYPYFTGPPTTIMSNNTDVRVWEINYEDYQ